MNDVQNNTSVRDAGQVSDDRLPATEELNRFSRDGEDPADPGDRARALLRHQRENWPMLAGGFSSLETVQARSIEFDGFEITLQFNPGRIVSSSAKVDKKSIKARKCFLCPANLPPEQKGLLYGDYMILGNPFPIFSEHFTIPHLEHIPQEIDRSFDAMLDLSEALGKHYTLFYNGPKCGASAPDHLHFQGGERGFMPIDHSWRALVDNHGSWIVNEDRIRAARVDDGLRRFVIFESDDKAVLADRFKRLYDAFKTASRKAGITESADEEPMLNVLASKEDNRWRVVAFLRKKHRPACYFLEGDAQVLFSPASVDFGGVCITPVERDFERLTAGDLSSMFREVSASPEMLKIVSDSL